MIERTIWLAVDDRNECIEGQCATRYGASSYLRDTSRRLAKTSRIITLAQRRARRYVRCRARRCKICTEEGMRNHKMSTMHIYYALFL